MSSPILQRSPSRPWGHVPGVTIGPGPWQVSPVYEVSWLESDYPASFALQAADWNHSESLDSDGSRGRGNDWTNYGESRVGGTKVWSSAVSTQTQTSFSQEQILIQLEQYTRTVEDIPGSWVDDVPPPPNLTSGQTWHVEYEGVEQDRTQLPQVVDVQQLVVRLTAEGNPGTGYAATAGTSQIRLVPKDRLPRNFGNWGNSAFGPQLKYSDSGSFPLVATFSFGASPSSGVVELVFNNPLASAGVDPLSGIAVMVMTVDTQADGIPFVGPPSGWDFDVDGPWQESWSARMDVLPNDDSNYYTLVWQPPRWRYVYEEPVGGVTGDVVGGVERQDLGFRPRVPTGGVRFVTASDLDPNWWRDFHPDPRLERGGPAFE